LLSEVQVINRKLQILAFTTVVFTTSNAPAAQFVVELTAPLANIEQEQLSQQALTLEQSFAAGQSSYAVFDATSQEQLQQFLDDNDIKATNISEVLFVNSPVLGGGMPAGDKPREGHQVFVIERNIPGVGSFESKKKAAISAGSNKAIAELGNIIEWDHSYLTSEGTFCVYRADSEDTIRAHGALAGAPVDKVTAVEQKSY
jgi:hypothetical protein